MSPTKKRQTMGKMTRERELKEKRAQKQERKDERKAEALRIAEGGEPVAEAEAVADPSDPESSPAVL